MYYLYRKHSTRIKVLSKIFDKNLYFDQKNQKVFDFGQNLRKTSLLYLKHWRSIDFFPIIFEKYVTLRIDWRNVISIPKHSNSIFFASKAWEKLLYFHSNHLKKNSILNENNQKRRAQTSNRYGEKYIASNQTVLNESRIIVENFRIFLKK